MKSNINLKQFIVFLLFIIIITSCQLNINEPDDIEENTIFILTINIVPPGAGTVTRNPDAAEYQKGVWVELTVQANTNYEFYNWEGDLKECVNSVFVQMTSNKTITANFNALPTTTPTSAPTPTIEGTPTLTPVPTETPSPAPTAEPTNIPTPEP